MAARASCAGACWIALAFAVQLFVTASVFGIEGVTEAGIVLALRLTARLAFPLFWLAYTGRALAMLLGPRFEPLRRCGRLLGLAFAASMTVHLALVATLCLVGETPPAIVFVIFGTAAAFMYTLALFSIARLRQALGPRGWKVLNVVAMNYVGLAFLYDFSNDVFSVSLTGALFYWPFLALAISGPALRLAALLRVAPTERASHARTGHGVPGNRREA